MKPVLHRNHDVTFNGCCIGRWVSVPPGQAYFVKESVISQIMDKDKLREWIAENVT